MDFAYKPTALALRLAGVLLGAEAKSRFTGRIPKLIVETR